MIRQCIGQSVFHQFAQETNAYSLWKKLEAMYERKHAQNKIFLIRQLLNSKYNEGSSVAEHLSFFQSILNQMTAVGIKFDDEMQSLFLLGSLPESFETLVVSLTNSAPDGILTMDMVKNSLFNEEMRRKGQAVVDNSQALVTDARGRQKNGKGQEKGRSKSRDPRRCFYCKQVGHIERNCFQKQRDEKNGKIGKKKANQKMVDSDDDNDGEGMSATTFCDGDIIISEEEKYGHMASSSADWVIDTGASFHATPNKEFFSTYKSGDFGTVRMGNTSQSKIAGIGDVCIRTNVGYILTLKDVCHVPDLRLNLISGVALDRHGYVSCFGNKRWKLVKESMVVARGATRDNLYKTHARVCYAGRIFDESLSVLWRK